PESHRRLPGRRGSRMSILLETRDLSAGYGALQVIKNIDIRVEEGRFTVVVGPNGAGKTTLMSALAGVLPVAQGEIRLDGAAINTLSVSQRVKSGLVLVPEGRHLFGQMTVQENLELGGYLMTAAQRRRTMDEVYALFPRLAERREQQSGSMSGGEQQMVAVGRALMGRPRCILLDEP